MNLSETAQKIIQLRNENGLTQQELADSLHVSRSLVGMWETGERIPDFANVSALAAAFNVDESEIVSDRGHVYSSVSEFAQLNLEIDEFAENDEVENIGDNTKILRTFLKKLGNKDYGIFMARYFYAKTYKAIASEFNMSESAVGVRLTRMRKKFKQAILKGEQQ